MKTIWKFCFEFYYIIIYRDYYLDFCTFRILLDPDLVILFISTFVSFILLGASAKLINVRNTEKNGR